MQNESEEIPRRSARFCVNFKVKCLPSVVALFQERESSFEGTLINLSNGGACMTTNHPLEVAEILKISFPVQTFISMPGTLVEVMWTKPTLEDAFTSGLRFLL